MAAPHITIRVLGTFEVTRDGERLVDRWPSRRAAELVQLLAITPGHVLVRDVVIDALWPHLDADAGAANLRKAAHHARRALDDDDAVVLRQQQVHLFPDAEVTTDLADFLAAADSALRTGDATAAAQAADAYGGELLPSARYESWAEATRRDAHGRQLELLLLAERWDAAVELEPADETATLGAMRSALDRGRRHLAASIFERHRQVLHDELGLTPSDELASLYREARRDLAPTDPTIVGRHRELATVDALLDGGDESPWLVVVSGGPGIGKSALAREIVRRAGARGRRTAHVTADAPHDAYAALTAVIDRLVDGRGDVFEQLDDKTRSVLAMLVAVPGTVRPLELPLTRHQVVGATQRLIRAVGGDGGVIVVVDDVDRADGPSLEVLSVLGDRDVGPLLVVFGHRVPSQSDAVDRAVARTARIKRPVEIALAPLDAADAAALARAVEPEIDADELDTVLARADGVPLFVIELARTHGLERTGQPEIVSTAIMTRFDELEEHELAWLRRLAIVGGRLDLPAVLALSGCEPDEADQLLDRALATTTLVVDDVGYRFGHELVREALAEQLPPHQRAGVHREAARRLIELGARPGRIADHWEAGHRPQDAADWLVAAADEAIRLGGYRAALDHVDRALALAPQHAVALRRRAEVLDALGDLRALAAYDAAIAVSDPADAHELRPLQALAQIKMGDPDGALVTIAGAQPTSLASQLAQALTMSGAALLGATGPEAGTALSAAGRRAALNAGDPAAVVVASWAQAAVAHARGELRESLRVDLAETAALPRLAVTVFDGQLCITQRLLYGNRPYPDVIRFTDEFLAEARRLGAARGVAFATTLRGEAELLSGRLDDAHRDLHEGARLHRQLEAATGESFSLQRLAELAHLRGDPAEARRLLDEALEIARVSDIGFHLLDRIYGTRIQLADDPDSALAMVVEAEEAVRGPFETCPGCRITLEMPAGIAAARAGDLERLERYERSCTWLAEVVMRLPAWDAALDELRGHRCLAHGDRPGAGEHFRAAAEIFGRIGQPDDAARCERGIAELLS